MPQTAPLPSPTRTAQRSSIWVPKAAQWADKIRNPKSVLDKLGLKPDHRVSVLNVADADFAASARAARRPRLDEQTDEGIRRDLPRRRDASTPSTASRSCCRILDRNGAIWTVTPKGKGGIKDTEILARIRPFGLVDVKVVAFSATHSANKFVIPKAKR